MLTVGPDAAADAIKKALQMGAHAGVHVHDAAIHGSDAAATSLVLAEAVTKAAGGTPDLVITGMSSTDGVMGVVPAMLAERLGLPPGHLRLRAHPRRRHGRRIRRDGDHGIRDHRGEPCRALVSVTDQINEPRYPSFKGIMAAKKKPVASVGARRPRHRPLASSASTPRGPRSVAFAKRPPGATRARSSPTRATAAPKLGGVPRRQEVHLSRSDDWTGRDGENPWLKYSFSSTTPTGGCARRPTGC